MTNTITSMIYTLLPILAGIFAISPFILILIRWMNKTDKINSMIIQVRIRNLGIDRDLLEINGKIDLYPNIFRSCEDILSFKEYKNFSLSKIVTKRTSMTKVVKDEVLAENFLGYIKELQKCMVNDDQEMLNFISSMIELKQDTLKKKSLLIWYWYKILDDLEMLRMKSILHSSEKTRDTSIESKELEVATDNYQIALAPVPC